MKYLKLFEHYFPIPVILEFSYRELDYDEYKLSLSKTYDLSNIESLVKKILAFTDQQKYKIFYYLKHGVDTMHFAMGHIGDDKPSLKDKASLKFDILEERNNEWYIIRMTNYLSTDAFSRKYFECDGIEAILHLIYDAYNNQIKNKHNEVP